MHRAGDGGRGMQEPPNISSRQASDVKQRATHIRVKSHRRGYIPITTLTIGYYTVPSGSGWEVDAANEWPQLYFRVNSVLISWEMKDSNYNEFQIFKCELLVAANEIWNFKYGKPYNSF